MPQVYGQKEQSSHIQTHILSIHIRVIPYSQHGQFGLVSWKTWTKGEKKKLSKEPDGRKTEETDAETIVEEEGK